MNDKDKNINVKKGGTVQAANSNNGNNGSSDTVCSSIPSMPTDPRYVYAYIRFQQDPIYYADLNQALSVGTIFEELNLTC